MSGSSLLDCKVAMGYMVSAVYHYWTAQLQQPSRPMLLLWPAAMATDISSPIVTSHTAKMGELTSAHMSLLDKTVFRHTFH
jgi:hypothetical protein